MYEKKAVVETDVKLNNTFIIIGSALKIAQARRM